MTGPSPSLNQAYSMIMQDESKKIQSSLISNCVLPLQKLDVNDSTVLASIHNNKFNQNTGLCCDHWHLRNHTKANCYKLIGYPQNYKLTKKKNVDDRCFKGQAYGNDKMQNYGYNHLLKMIDKESSPQNHVVNMDLCIGKVRGIGKEE
ncbi:hypothetical protein KY284_010691 [Solanum tuberosum]|nr:hypothetical protein KY284_010691 [Solanum tuberosum]